MLDTVCSDLEDEVVIVTCHGYRHLDADEAVALGAAMVAANMSTTFRLGKKFGMSDGASYPVVFQVSQQQAYVLCKRSTHCWSMIEPMANSCLAQSPCSTGIRKLRCDLLPGCLIIYRDISSGWRICGEVWENILPRQIRDISDCQRFRC